MTTSLKAVIARLPKARRDRIQRQARQLAEDENWRIAVRKAYRAIEGQMLDFTDEEATDRAPTGAMLAAMISTIVALGGRVSFKLPGQEPVVLFRESGRRGLRRAA